MCLKFFCCSSLLLGSNLKDVSFLQGFNLCCFPPLSFFFLISSPPPLGRIGIHIVFSLLEMIGTRVLITLTFECSRLFLRANIGIMDKF